MGYRDIITVDAEKRGGRPCIRGLRITVDDVLSWIASGMSEEIVSDYPDLTRDDIRAAVAYAAEHQQGFHVGPELKAVLLAAMVRCDRGETISGDELLDELRRDE
jgi:uncharacterized protein (DUF433 family)